MTAKEKLQHALARLKEYDPTPEDASHVNVYSHKDGSFFEVESEEGGMLTLADLRELAKN
jgi:hypothetical protein